MTGLRERASIAQLITSMSGSKLRYKPIKGCKVQRRSLRACVKVFHLPTKFYVGDIVSYIYKVVHVRSVKEIILLLGAQ